jgi:undecaprenyl diphosphate synthase
LIIFDATLLLSSFPGQFFLQQRKNRLFIQRLSLQKVNPPGPTPVPQHIAVIMDGNRRWAQRLGLPIALGHASGARRVRGIVQACADRGVEYITLFAFSTENWARPPSEVSSLMGLLALYLQKEVKDMNTKGVRLKVVGDTSRFTPRIQALIRDAEANTAHNTTITLTIAANYGGRWDMVQAVKAWQIAHPGETAEALDEKTLSPYLALAYAPDPELLIRTGGESRISNFMLWQQAYTELFFTDVLWPSFTAKELDIALAWYAQRDRRFGGTSPLPHAVNSPAVFANNSF